MFLKKPFLFALLVGLSIMSGCNDSDPVGDISNVVTEPTADIATFDNATFDTANWE